MIKATTKKKPQIIVIHSGSNCGKDNFSEYIINDLLNRLETTYILKHVSDYLYDFISNYFKIDKTLLKAFRKDDIEVFNISLNYNHPEHKKSSGEIFKKAFNARELLIYTADKLKASLGDDIFINRFMNDIRYIKKDFVVLTDLRYKIELQTLLSNKYKVHFILLRNQQYAGCKYFNEDYLFKEIIKRRSKYLVSATKVNIDFLEDGRGFKYKFNPIREDLYKSFLTIFDIKQEEGIYLYRKRKIYGKKNEFLYNYN